MKVFNFLMSIFFKERFGFFDVIVMFFLVGLSEVFKNPFLMLLMLPVGFFSASMAIRVRNQEQKNA